MGLLLPALNTTTVGAAMASREAKARSNKSSTSSGDVASMTTASAEPPSAVIASATPRIFASVRPPRKTSKLPGREPAGDGGA